MTPGVHSDIGPELKKLAQKILDQVDPAIRLAASLAAGNGPGTGPCQQAWCPVCALAAAVTGEEHPLVTVVAEHSVALLAAIRAVVDQTDRPAPTPEAGGDSAEEATQRPAPASRYQPISITVED
jgi:hypothetical protein